MTQNKRPLAWHVVENKILEEMEWLRSAIETSPFENEAREPISCKECLLRKTAILIVNGKVRAKEIKKSSSLKSFWANKKRHPEQQKRPQITHGANWHNTMMKRIENHFLYQNYKVEREPNLHWGRADLGVFRSGEPALYIEVGTTSLFKLLTNLNAMKNCVYLIVPDDNKLIEFICPKTGFPRNGPYENLYFKP